MTYVLRYADGWEDDGLGYFGVTTSGFYRRFIDPMVSMGAVCKPVPPTDADWAVCGDVNDEMYNDTELYKKVFHPVLASHRGECPGIPLFKLESNDPWLITPAEIRPALEDIYRCGCPWPEEDDTERWDQWVEFLRGALDHGGFRCG